MQRIWKTATSSTRSYTAIWQPSGCQMVLTLITSAYFPMTPKALRAWNWLGFGIISVDAICGLDILQGNNADLDIRRAEPSDIEQVIELHEALRVYMKGTPVFLLTEKKDSSYHEEWLRNPGKVVWLAYQKSEPVAFIRLGPADDDVSTIINDEKTTSIYGAFTREEA